MAQALNTFRASFAPLRIRNLRIYLGGQAVSLIGTWLQSTAQSLVVYRLSNGSATALGFTAMLTFLPSLLLGPFTGVIADRFDRRRLLMGTQAVAMLLAFALSALVFTELAQLWHVYVFAAILGTVTALDLPAQQTFLGDLAGMAEVRKAVNLNAMILNVSRFLGPALGGFIVGQFGAPTAFFLNGLSFIAVLWSLSVVRTAPPEFSSRMASAKGGFGDAVRFIRANARVQDLMMFVVIMTFLGFPTLTVIPAVAQGVAEVTGALLAASGLGSLVGVVFVVPFAQASRRTGVVLTLALAWFGAWLIAFAILTAATHALVLSLLTMFLSSMAAPVVMTMALGLLQFLAPIDMRARILSVFNMVSFGMQPIAALLIGASADHFGATTAVLINGAVIIAAVALLIIVRRELRTWDATMAGRAGGPPAPAASPGH